MNNDLPSLPYVIIYPVLAFFICRWVYKVSRPMGTGPKLMVRSFVYALFFGMGSIPSEFFHLPAPVLIAAVYSTPDLVMTDSIIPFLFCWGLILIVLLIDAYFKKRDETKKAASYDEEI